MSRYRVTEKPRSDYGRFEATVVDSTRPLSLLQEFEPVCECFTVADANLIADALNAAVEVAADKQRMDWLDTQYTGADFAYGESEDRQVLIIDMVDGQRISPDLRDTVDRALDLAAQSYENPVFISPELDEPFPAQPSESLSPLCKVREGKE
jgi:hypothetical protein